MRLVYVKIYFVGPLSLNKKFQHKIIYKHTYNSLFTSYDNLFFRICLHKISSIGAVNESRTFFFFSNILYRVVLTVYVNFYRRGFSRNGHHIE